MEESGFIATASLICEPSRARILWNLLDGRAYTAGELALVCDSSPTAVSNHLAKLLTAGLLKVDVQGRHRYYSFANAEVAYVVESLANLSITETKGVSPRDYPSEGIQYCRSCYDHLAGKIGVLVTERLIALQVIEIHGKDCFITELGHGFLTDFGLDLEHIKKRRRHLARTCLDWSERKPHLAGALGSALFERMLALDWLRKTRNSRALVLTSIGRQGLLEQFNIQL